MLFRSLICFDQPSRVYRLQYFPLPGTLARMHDEALALVTARRSATPLHVRPFPGVGSGFAARVSALAAPGVTLAEGGSIVAQYAATRVAIHAYLGSSWLETMGWDVPTVCLHDPASYAFRPDAAPLLDALRRVGILHDSAASAAAHLASIDADPAAWWGSAEVQLARIAFCDRYADRKSTRLNSSHVSESRMPSSA